MGNSAGVFFLPDPFGASGIRIDLNLYTKVMREPVPDPRRLDETDGI
jgi:hypothetical protein